MRLRQLSIAASLILYTTNEVAIADYSYGDKKGERKISLPFKMLKLTESQSKVPLKTSLQILVFLSYQLKFASNQMDLYHTYHLARLRSTEPHFQGLLP